MIEGESAMPELTLDEPLSTQLRTTPSGTELRDVRGLTLGVFLSPEAYERLQYSAAKSLVSEADINLARAQPRGKQLNEFFPPA